jgi:hypothetical protein
MISNYRYHLNESLYSIYINQIKSEEYKYYHIPKYNKCSECRGSNSICELCEEIYLQHPLNKIESDDTKEYYELALTSVIYNGISLRYVSNKLSNDEIIVIAAVESHGSALQFASSRLKNSVNVVYIAVSQWGKALQFTSEKLRSNRKIVMASVKDNKYNGLRFASNELKSDEELITLAMLNNNGFAFYDASTEIVSKGIISFIQKQIYKYKKNIIILSKFPFPDDIIDIIKSYSYESYIVECLINIKKYHRKIIRKIKWRNEKKKKQKDLECKFQTRIYINGEFYDYYGKKL